MWKEYFLILISVIGVIRAQYKVNEACTGELEDDEEITITGTCQIIHTCPFARNLIANGIHPPMCSWEGRTRIVCCPENKTHLTGIFSRFFKSSEDGILRNHDTICRYNGQEPMMCCPIPLDVPQAPEPKECPPLPTIKTPKFTNPALIVAWEKCVANERYVHICEQTEKYPFQYTRTPTCNITDKGPRIVNGAPAAAISEFPHMAVLGCHNGIKTEDVDIVWVGGGSLISDKYILTAGHVLLHVTHDKLRYAMLGALNKTNLYEAEIYNIIRIIPHPRYTNANKYNDIALVELDRRVKFSQFIRPICLPVPGITYDDTLRVIAGWGSTGPDSPTSNLLMKAYVDKMDTSFCEKNLKRKEFTWDNSTMICAQGTEVSHGRFTDTCPGDSGGPLMAYVTNRKFSCNYVVEGIVSWGPKCGSGAPGAYTRVSAYIDWIVQEVWSADLKDAKEESVKNIFL